MRSFLTIALTGLILAAPALSAQPADAKPLMRDFMGINTHTVQFRPELYKDLCRLVRDYHSVDWDIRDGGLETMELPRSQFFYVGEAERWSGQVVDWGDLYGSWRDEGFLIDVCLMISSTTRDEWREAHGDFADLAEEYGRQFAATFGPNNLGLVEAVEIGNETPSAFSPEEYRRVFEQTARGLRAGDPDLTIVTATVQAKDPDGYHQPVEVLEGLEELIDALNIHMYAHVQGYPTWERSYPEDPAIDYLTEIQELIDYRDEKMPGKPVWLTEFGYDATTMPPPETGTFAKWLDVTDEKQAEWIVRSFLVFAEMDIERAYLFWFNDGDTPQVHGAAGVTRDFEPKMSFWAMKHLYETLGDYRFNQAIRKDVGELYVYEFVHGDDDSQKVWVVWNPTDAVRKSDVTLAIPAAPERIERMPIMPEQDNAFPVTMTDDGSAVTLQVNGSPLYLWFTAD